MMPLRLCHTRVSCIATQPTLKSLTVVLTLSLIIPTNRLPAQRKDKTSKQNKLAAFYPRHHGRRRRQAQTRPSITTNSSNTSLHGQGHGCGILILVVVGGRRSHGAGH